jgi:hypothetical protein
VVVTTIVMSIVAHVSDLPYVTTFADSFVDGSAGSPTQSNQNAATTAAGIMDGTAAGTARSLGHPKIVSDVSIGSQASAIEPRLVKIFAGLHVKTYRYGTGLTYRVGRGPSTRAAAEVARDAVARAKMKAIAVAVAVAVPIPIAILRRRQRNEGNQK